ASAASTPPGTSPWASRSRRSAASRKASRRTSSSSATIRTPRSRRGGGKAPSALRFPITRPAASCSGSPSPDSLLTGNTMQLFGHKGRLEDQRMLTGRGRYVSDWQLAGQVYGHFVRSDRAHAEIRGIDKEEALKMPGVLAVLTGEDVAAAGFKPLPAA